MWEYITARKQLLWIFPVLLMIIPIFILSYTLLIPTTTAPIQPIPTPVPNTEKIMQITIRYDSTASASLKLSNVLILNAYPPKKPKKQGSYTLNVLNPNSGVLTQIPFSLAQLHRTTSSQSGEAGYIVLLYPYTSDMHKLVITDTHDTTLSEKNLSEAKFLDNEMIL